MAYYPPERDQHDVWRTPMFGVALCDLCSRRNWGSIPGPKYELCTLKPKALPTHECRLFEREPGVDDDRDVPIETRYGRIG